MSKKYILRYIIALWHPATPPKVIALHLAITTGAVLFACQSKDQMIEFTAFYCNRTIQYIQEVSRFSNLLGSRLGTLELSIIRTIQS